MLQRSKILRMMHGGMWLLIAAATGAAPTTSRNAAMSPAPNIMETREGETLVMKVPEDPQIVDYTWAKEGRIICTGRKIIQCKTHTEWWKAGCQTRTASWRHWCEQRHHDYQANEKSLRIGKTSVGEAGLYNYTGATFKPWEDTGTPKQTWQFELRVLNMATPKLFVRGEQVAGSHFSYNDTVEIVCKEAGSYPPPVLTWLKDGVIVRRQDRPQSTMIEIVPEDDGALVSCKLTTAHQTKTTSTKVRYSKGKRKEREETKLQKGQQAGNKSRRDKMKQENPREKLEEETSSLKGGDATHTGPAAVSAMVAVTTITIFCIICCSQNMGPWRSRPAAQDDGSEAEEGGGDIERGAGETERGTEESL